jgi:hypothetical protein
MVALLRRCMVSWRWHVTVGVGCAAFIALTVWLEPFIRLWSWEVSVVVRGLEVIALLVVVLIIGHAFGRFLIYILLGKELNRRTPKAKEKLADSLMSVSTATQSATWIGLFVFPLTAFLQTMTSGTDPVSALMAWWRPDRWSGWHTVVFLAIFWLPLSVGLLGRRRALDFYDELSIPAPAAKLVRASFTSVRNEAGSRWVHPLKEPPWQTSPRFP